MLVARRLESEESLRWRRQLTCPVLNERSIAVSDAVSENRTAMKTPVLDKPEAETRARGVQDNEASPSILAAFRRAKRRYGHVPLSTRIRAREPKLLYAAERMNQYTASPGAVDPKLKELVQLKVAAMVGCPF